MKLSFSSECLQPTGLHIQFKEEGESFKKVFETEGKASFDDDMPLEEIKRHETDIMGYLPLTFPSDFTHPQKNIPVYRQSAEEEYPLKTAGLPDFKLIEISSVYSFPLNVPTHQFICNDLTVNRYK